MRLSAQRDLAAFIACFFSAFGAFTFSLLAGLRAWVAACAGIEAAMTPANRAGTRSLEILRIVDASLSLKRRITSSAAPLEIRLCG